MAFHQSVFTPGDSGQSIFIGDRRFRREAFKNGISSELVHRVEIIVYKNIRHCVLFVLLIFTPALGLLTTRGPFHERFDLESRCQPGECCAGCRAQDLLRAVDRGGAG
ncbi:hypothetical protein D9M71_655580 [compost metagenome]